MRLLRLSGASSVCLVCSALATAAPPPPFGYKGIPLGATEHQLTSRRPEFKCKNERAIRVLRSCTAIGLTYAGERTKEVYARFVLDKLIWIQIDYPETPALDVSASSGILKTL